MKNRNNSSDRWWHHNLLTGAFFHKFDSSSKNKGSVRITDDTKSSGMMWMDYGSDLSGTTVLGTGTSTVTPPIDEEDNDNNQNNNPLLGTTIKYQNNHHNHFSNNKVELGRYSDKNRRDFSLGKKIKLELLKTYPSRLLQVQRTSGNESLDNNAVALTNQKTEKFLSQLFLRGFLGCSDYHDGLKLKDEEYQEKHKKPRPLYYKIPDYIWCVIKTAVRSFASLIRSPELLVRIINVSAEHLYTKFAQLIKRWIPKGKDSLGKKFLKVIGLIFLAVPALVVGAVLAGTYYTTKGAKALVRLVTAPVESFLINWNKKGVIPKVGAVIGAVGSILAYTVGFGIAAVTVGLPLLAAAATIGTATIAIATVSLIVSPIISAVVGGLFGAIYGYNRHTTNKLRKNENKVSSIPSRINKFFKGLKNSAEGFFNSAFTDKNNKNKQPKSIKKNNNPKDYNQIISKKSGNHALTTGNVNKINGDDNKNLNNNSKHDDIKSVSSDSSNSPPPQKSKKNLDHTNYEVKSIVSSYGTNVLTTSSRLFQQQHKNKNNNNLPIHHYCDDTKTNQNNL